jgi:hypothetical protein
MVHGGMWAKTTIGVLDERASRSAFAQASCRGPRTPSPPSLKSSTLISATKCTPAWSKL